MATHGYSGGQQNWTMGGIAHRVLNAIKIPVLTVRPPDMGNTQERAEDKSSIAVQEQEHASHQ